MSSGIRTRDAVVLLLVLGAIVLLNSLVDIFDWLNRPLFGPRKKDE